MRSIDLTELTPVSLPSVSPLRLRAGRQLKSTRFVTQTHALGRPMANPMALIIAAAVAIAVYLLGSRLSH